MEMQNATRKELKEIPISEIDFENRVFQNRKELHSDYLEESLKQDGQQVPVELRELNDKYQIICGFRRCNALRAINARSVIAFIHKPETDEKFLNKLSLIENIQRETLTDLEKIDACASLFHNGTSKKELASIYNVGNRTIENYIRISTKSDNLLREAIQEGILTIHQAFPLIGKESQKIKQAIKDAQEGNFSVRRAKVLANKREKVSFRKPINQIKRFKQGFNLKIRFRNDYDEKTQKDIKDVLLLSLSLIERTPKNNDKTEG
jgi:ParB family transcriptional regulator, chromosome partitioning protein